ncbi:MAG: hypothetical protein FWH04_06730 [Oscillospiraceae bacterium]|nr:hypothetical protein [Oscillospiraceae bacterium]
MRETDAILQSILFSAETSKDLEECIEKIKVMCTKENLDAVNALLAERERRTKKNN